MSNVGQGVAAAQAPAAPRTAEWILDNGTSEEIADLARRVQNGEEIGGDGGEEAGGDETGSEGEVENHDDGQDDGSQEHEEEPEQTGKPKPRRIQIHRFKPKDQALLIAAQDLSAKTPGMDLVTALKEVGMDFGTAEAVSEEVATQEAQVVAAADPLQVKLTQLEELQTKRDEAEASYDFESKRTLQRQIDALNREIVKLELTKDAEQGQAQHTHEAAVAKVTGKIAEVAPEFFQKGTPLEKAASAIDKDLPESFYKNPNWPKRLFAMAWAEAHPDQPMPSFDPQGQTRKPVAQAAPIAKKRGYNPAVLSSGTGGNHETLVARAMSPNATQADIEAAANADAKRSRG